MNVCLINPPQLNSLDDRLDAPLGLLYIAASIRDMGMDVRIADLSAQPFNKWERLIGHADIYGIGIYTCNFIISKEIKKVCKRLNPKAPVIAGGPHASVLPEEVLEHGAHIVVRGEGEETAAELVEWLKGERELNRIDRISYCAGDGIRHNPFHAAILEDNADHSPDHQ